LTPEDNRLSRWYAVYCQPHRESAAASHLRNQDFAVFLPKREKMRRHARKIEKVRRPFFPGYLFISLDINRERWRSINSTVGVIRIVMQNDSPAPAPRGVVEGLLAACDKDQILRFIPNLTVGQKVRVIDGPLADLIGELDQLTDTERVRVLLDILGGQTRVVLPREYLVPADS
jgi:transcription elongation factor/antiterminator RfaH